jgi:hypothetical protein
MQEYTVQRVSITSHAIDRYEERVLDGGNADATMLRRTYAAAVPIEHRNRWGDTLKGLHDDLVHVRYHHHDDAIFPVKPDCSVPTVLRRQWDNAQVQRACLRAHFNAVRSMSHARAD